MTHFETLPDRALDYQNLIEIYKPLTTPTFLEARSNHLKLKKTHLKRDL